MRTVAEILQLGLDRASCEGQSHYLGMCSIIIGMYNERLITAPESKATLHWIDEQISWMDNYVYLIHWLQEKHATEDSDELYALWHQWYTDKIKELNEE